MKLRNKKTGEIISSKELLTNEFIIDLFSKDFNYFNSKINKIQEEWEDYEEPKEHWCITMYGGITRIKDDEEPVDDLIEIGNYFNDKESAYDALFKLKAVKRLKDKGFEITDWAVADGNELRFFGHYSDAGIKDDLDLLFGGEE